MNIAIIGSGYVGLVTGAILAHIGHQVICVDKDKAKIKMLKSGKIPIYEPALDPIIRDVAHKKRLVFSNNLVDSLPNTDVVLITVNTPPKKDGSCDLSYVADVAREIALHMKKYTVIVDKSTVPVQTGEKVAETIRRYNKDKIEFDVVSNPEFLREGNAVHDSLNPDRIVIGVTSRRAEKVMKELYKHFKCRFIVTDIKSAELIKHASNSFLAMKISFANALSQVCDLSGANVQEVVLGMGLDARIGSQFLNAGIGYGGSCFPKDVAAFIHIAKVLGYEFKLLEAVELINKQQKQYFIDKIHQALWVLKNKTVGVLGLAFKPNTDDMRSAPSIDIIHSIQNEGAHVKAYDPYAHQKAKSVLPNISYCKNAYETAKGADALLVLTEWDEFKKLDFKKIYHLMTTPVLIDGRNLLDPQAMRSIGFIYSSMGRP